MDIQFVYQKRRETFGRQPMFCEFGPELCDSIPVNPAEQKHYILRNPVHTGTQNTKFFGEHEINTIRAEFTTTGINHGEGGWPKDVNVMDPEQTQRYRRKIEKDDNYIHCVMSAATGMENLILQNNAIDMYQIYNTELDPWPGVEHISCRTTNVYRDGKPTAPKRPITSIAWKPDGGNKFAVTYVDVDFNRELRAPATCQIWDVENANSPEIVITPPFAALDMQYNPRNMDLLAGGLINGQVAVWDMRSGFAKPSTSCPPHVAHRDLVRNVRFVNAKSGMEFFSGGPDGACKWWDIRNMSNPTDEMIIDTVLSANDVPSMAKSNAINCIEFEPTIPSRFMVGTENGFVISGNRKGKTSLDRLPAKYAAHNGTIWTVERNPGFLKNFLTVGDWTARVWSEECRESAIIWTAAKRHKITFGAWSPTRLSLFLLTQSNGQLTLWDLLRRQHEPVLTLQVCEEPLLRVVPHDGGVLAAVGTSKGTIYMQELSPSLSTSSKHDKSLLTAIFDRENKRERILEARMREIRVKLRAADEHSPAASESDLDATIGDKDLHEATTEYFQAAKKELAAM